jgi:outer membrane protein assembly factor BamD (BamD/ComL family)
MTSVTDWYANLPENDRVEATRAFRRYKDLHPNADLADWVRSMHKIASHLPELVPRWFEDAPRC